MAKSCTAKIRTGLYELRGVTHTRQKYPGAPVCGGQVFAEWFPSQHDGGEFRPVSWECFCEKCGDCDPNGWDTLRECVEAAPEFWADQP